MTGRMFVIPGASLIVVALCFVPPASAQVAASGAEQRGRLFQVLDAVPLRGEEVRLRVALRVHESSDPACAAEEAEPGEFSRPPSDCESAAFGWLRIDGPPADGPGPELHTMRVASGQWSVEEVRATIPQDAIELRLGIALDGPGPMWADDVQLALRQPDGVFRRIPLPNSECEAVATGGRPAAWGGIDPDWEARIDREYPYEGSGAIRITRRSDSSG